MNKPDLYLVRLAETPIYSQLQLEEALLRTDTNNWCILNDKIPKPAIVMGISGKESDHIHHHNYAATPLPIIKRFSGGGTVVVDSDSCFISFIMNRNAVNIPATPDQIFRWSDQFYRSVFADLDYRLIETDYTFGNRKFGGNAQYIRKDRWLHHSTFLWDYQQRYMELLARPQKQPKYRENRPHADFICAMKNHLSERHLFWSRVEAALHTHFRILPAPQNLFSMLDTPHRKTTVLRDDYHSVGPQIPS